MAAERNKRKGFDMRDTINTAMAVVQCEATGHEISCETFDTLHGALMWSLEMLGVEGHGATQEHTLRNALRRAIEQEGRCTIYTLENGHIADCFFFD